MQHCQRRCISLLLPTEWAWLLFCRRQSDQNWPSSFPGTPNTRTPVHVRTHTQVMLTCGNTCRHRCAHTCACAHMQPRPPVILKPHVSRVSSSWQEAAILPFSFEQTVHCFRISFSPGLSRKMSHKFGAEASFAFCSWQTEEVLGPHSFSCLPTPCCPRLLLIALGRTGGIDPLGATAQMAAFLVTVPQSPCPTVLCCCSSSLGGCFGVCLLEGDCIW